MNIEIYQPGYAEQVSRMVLTIQNEEFGIPITLAQQEDLSDIPGFFQFDAGNFWVALDGGKVIGAVGLRDIGHGQTALRKMFVQSEYRGKQYGVAQALLETAVNWAAHHQLREILLGTSPLLLAAHRFYEKNNFEEIPISALPSSFPIMKVDTKFYKRTILIPSDSVSQIPEALVAACSESFS